MEIKPNLTHERRWQGQSVARLLRMGPKVSEMVHRLFFSLLEMTLENSWIIFFAIVNGDGKRKLLAHLNFKSSVGPRAEVWRLNLEQRDTGRIGILAPKIRSEAKIGPKRRKSRLSVETALRRCWRPFSIFRTRCKCCRKTPRKRMPCPS